MSDLISRKATLKYIENVRHGVQMMDDIRRASIIMNGMYLCEKAVRNQPSAQPEVRTIDYQDCSNAMLKMWMDNVVTDGEYNRIMDKLNAHWGKKHG